MVIGDTVIYDGRRWTIVGFTPVSVTPAQIELESPVDGTRRWVDRATLAGGGPAERAALRLLRGRKGDDAAS